MKYIVTNILWDTDDFEGNIDEELYLPKTMEVTVPEDITDTEDINEYISDYITDKEGFCHKGFSLTPEIN